MSSSESLFSDTSDMDLGDFTPPSSLTNNSVKSSQGSRKEPPSSHNPTPEPLAYDEGSNLSHSDTLPVKAKAVKIKVVKPKNNETIKM